MDKIKAALVPILIVIIGFFLNKYADKIDRISEKVDVVVINTENIKVEVESIKKREDRVEDKVFPTSNNENKKDNTIAKSNYHFLNNDSIQLCRNKNSYKPVSLNLINLAFYYAKGSRIFK